VHLVGFTVEIYYDARSYKRQFFYEYYFFFQIARAALWHSRAKVHAVYAPSQTPCKHTYFSIVETNVNSWVKWYWRSFVFQFCARHIQSVTISHHPLNIRRPVHGHKLLHTYTFNCVLIVV
jgi:hypothetical protein